MGVRLYDLAAEYVALMDPIDMVEVGGDVVDTTTGEVMERAEFDKRLASLAGAIEDKAQNCAAVIRMLEAEAEAQREEARRIAARAQSNERRAEWLRGYVRECLESTGLKKQKGPLFTLSVLPPVPKVKITDAGALPSEFVEVVEKPRLTRILAVLKEGMEVPGAVMEHGTSRLQIR